MADPDRADHPIGGTALLKTAALASVPAERLPELLSRVQADLTPRLEEYRRRYERVEQTPTREAFLVEPDHWEAIGSRVGLAARECDAALRAHETAVVQSGGEESDRDALETALEIRSAVVIGVEDFS